MKQVYFALLCLWLTLGVASAQELTKRDTDEITYQAHLRLKKLNEVLNLLTEDGLPGNERDTLILNSIRPSAPNRVFFDDKVVIEDDIDPRHTTTEGAVDVKYDRYLGDLALLFSKTDDPTKNPLIVFTPAIGEFLPAQQQGSLIYIKGFFKSTFKGKHDQITTAYVPTSRVVELRAERNAKTKKWEAFIIRLAFARPGEGMEHVEANKPTQSETLARKDNGRPTIPDGLSISGPVVAFRQSENGNGVELKFNREWVEVTQAASAEVPTGFYQRRGKVYVYDDQNNIEFQNNNNRFVFHKGLNFTGYDRVVQKPTENATPPASATATTSPTPSPTVPSAQTTAIASRPSPQTATVTNRPSSEQSKPITPGGNGLARPESVTSTALAYRPEPKSVTPSQPASVTGASLASNEMPKAAPSKPIVVKPAPEKSATPALTQSLSAEAKRQKARYRSMGWLQMVTGIVGLVGSYYTYATIRKDYSAYSASVDKLNAEYNAWSVLARNPTGGTLTPMPISTYGKPGTYGAYAGGAISMAMVVNGVRLLTKAAKIKPVAK